MTVVRSALLFVWRALTLLIAVFSAGIALFDFNVRNAIDEYGVEANAAVITPPPSELRAGQAVIKFQTQDGRTITAKPALTRRGDLVTGEPVSVTYLPHRPEIFAVEPRPTSNSTVAIGLTIAVLALLPTLLWAWRSRHLLTPPRIILGRTADDAAKKEYSRRIGKLIVVFLVVFMPLGKFIWRSTDFAPPAGPSVQSISDVKWQAAEATIVAKSRGVGAIGGTQQVTVTYRPAIAHGTAGDVKTTIAIDPQIFNKLSLNDRVFVRYDPRDWSSAIYGLSDRSDNALGIFVLIGMTIAGAIGLYFARDILLARLQKIEGMITLAGVVIVALWFGFYVGWGLVNQVTWELGMAREKRFALAEVVDYRFERGYPHALYVFTAENGTRIERWRRFWEDEVTSPDDVAIGRRIPIVYFASGPQHNRPLVTEEQIAPKRKFYIATSLILLLATSMIGAISIGAMLDRLRGRGGGRPTIPPSRLDKFVHPRT